MQKWQYLRDEVANETELDERLTHWGGLGWELVAVCFTGSNYSLAGENEPAVPWKMFFKQPSADV
jgi:hypothetical protein